jgi:Uma2 family endonuclease
MAIEYRTEPEFIEYLDGEAHPKVSPRMRHGVIQAEIVALLKRTAPQPSIIAAEGDTAVEKDPRRRTKLIPDVSFYFPERFKGLTYDEQDDPPFSPEVAIEVRSRGDSQQYLDRKIARYFATGASLVLDVNFHNRTIVAYTPEGKRTFEESERFANEPFPWFTFELRELFSVLDPLPDWVE